ncbi:albusnodin/ikarugamycin family macrolactam cyclase [Streptomyces xiamenensis]|uniref:albusnodin/ikarugamycin family macrolactam cyclase n=1 Tax=Streptomyces xiamenensis TaxID=408015 RepID=UPI0036E9E32B
MFFGGFTSRCGGGQRPEGTEFAADHLWSGAATPIRLLEGPDGNPMAVLGLCGAADTELAGLAGSPLPDDVTWRWPGTYAVMERRTDRTVLHTDPAGAVPLYAMRVAGGWAWSSSSRALASLTGAAVDPERVAAFVALSHVPPLGARSFFAGVELLPPGCRIELHDDGGPLSCTAVWRPDPVPGDPARRLRLALQSSVRARTVVDPDVSADLSGGLDSSTLALLAAAARTDGGRVNAVTVHPVGDLGGADLRYARLVAARDPRISHHLLPLGADLRPYTDITAVPPTDEPAPSTLARARLEHQLLWMKSEFGCRTHMTGDGGDSVLFVPPGHLADLWRHRRWTRAMRDAAGWARLRHTPVVPLLRDARALTGTNRAKALAALARTLEPGTDPGGSGPGNVSWFPPVPVPPWITPAGRAFLSAALRRAAAETDPLPGLDIGPRALVDEIREVARTAAADAQLAAVHGITMHNPFLDPTVVNAVLRTELRIRPPLHDYKPVLRRAMRRVLPPELAARTTKGSFAADHYGGMRANLPALTALTEGHLAGLGLIDPGLLRAHLATGAAGIPMPLAPIEQALTAEAWLHAIHRAPTPVWIRQGAPHA